VIEVPSGVAGLVVHRDGEVVDQAVWNTAMPVDPGTYTITAEAPGFVAWSALITVGAGATRQAVTVPALERVAVAAPPEGEPPAPRFITTRRTGTWSTARKFSVVAGVLGAGAVGTGIYFGWRANDLQDRADRRCPLLVCNDAEGLQLNNDARTSALTANILYIAGGASLATAVVLWLAGAPEEIVVVPAVGDRQASISMTGRF
jgi:hypothetical protein